MTTQQGGTDGGMEYLRSLGIQLNETILPGIYSLSGEPFCKYGGMILRAKSYVTEESRLFGGTVLVGPEFGSIADACYVPLAEVEFSVARP